MRAALEPLGILHGEAARIALETGLGRPLAGGPAVFTMVRPLGGVPVAVGAWSGPLDALTRAAPSWAGLPAGPQVMGILNVTPDSFSDGGALDPGLAGERGRQMEADGAAIVDVGGESTRPGAEPVPPDEEQRRILPVIAALAREGVRISVDTRNAATMIRALDAGAAIVNDVSALRHDPGSAKLVASRGCPVILMHMRGNPQTMRGLTQYGDVAADVLAELAGLVHRAEAAGVVRDRIAVDPGFGFAKTAAQSRALLDRLSLLVNLGCPIIAGLSRKGFVGGMAGVSDPQARGPASVAAGLVALARGAVVLRVHDVLATVQAVRVWRALACHDRPAQE